LAGFTSSGIASSSFAAGSTFATLQSLGATANITTVEIDAASVTDHLLAIEGVYYYFRSKEPAICDEYTENSD